MSGSGLLEGASPSVVTAPGSAAAAAAGAVPLAVRLAGRAAGGTPSRGSNAPGVAGLAGSLVACSSRRSSSLTGPVGLELLIGVAVAATVGTFVDARAAEGAVTAPVAAPEPGVIGGMGCGAAPSLESCSSTTFVTTTYDGIAVCVGQTDEQVSNAPQGNPRTASSGPHAAVIVTTTATARGAAGAMWLCGVALACLQR